MTRISVSLVALLLFTGVSFAQTGVSDRCKVFVVNITGKNPSDAKFSNAIELGAFDTIAGEEERTTKTYRLPNTRLYVIASVWYTDESLASAKGADSISLELLIGRQPRRDMLRSLTYADAEMPVVGFDVGRVTTSIKTGKRTRVVLMECRQGRRE
jgi:hypothetical protein